VEERLAERGVEVDYLTVYRWVQRFTPLLADPARPCRPAVGTRWRLDEAYAFVRNVRRGHYELAVDELASRRLPVAFALLALAI
jgi:transposase-like protein